MDLARQIIIVTGAGRGIGAETARQLSAAGARVAVAARRLADAEAIATSCPGAIAVACDVGDAEAVEAIVAEIAGRLGSPTTLINNAGTIAPIGRLDTVDPEAFAASIRTNLVGAALCARAVLPHMLAAKSGRIINLSSGAAHTPLEGWSAYCAGKAGLAMLTRSLALEYGPLGIQVFGFAPGIVDTDMQSAIRASGINRVSQLPRASLAPPSDPARALVYLCTPSAARYAGAEIDIRDAEFRRAASLSPLAG